MMRITAKEGDEIMMRTTAKEGDEIMMRTTAKEGGWGHDENYC